MLPPLDSRGLLPPGVHGGTFLDIESAFARKNSWRRCLFDQFRRFCREELTSVAADLELVVGGSYISDLPRPDDLDCTIVVPLNKWDSHRELRALLQDGRCAGPPGFRGRIWAKYKVHIIESTTDDQGRQSFVDKFQEVGIKMAARKGLQATDRRGVVKVAHWTNW